MLNNLHPNERVDNIIKEEGSLRSSAIIGIEETGSSIITKTERIRTYSVYERVRRKSAEGIYYAQMVGQTQM